MKVLVVGNGGREHALAWKIGASPLVEEVLCAPGNGGTQRVARNCAVAATDLDGLVRAVATPEQGAELYLAARLAIDLDEPAERAFLDALAARLKLPPELRGALDGAPRS